MTHVFQNVFTLEEILTLYKVLAFYSGDGNKIEETGRYIISSTFIDRFNGMSKIIEKIENNVSNVENKKMKMATSGFHLYKTSYGIPTLMPHIDEYAGQVVFDYQLDSSIYWPIKINKEDYVLNNNEAVMFNGEEVVHSRPKSNFKGNDYVLMFIVNLIDEKHWYNFSNQNPKTHQSILNEIIEIRKDKENW